MYFEKRQSGDITGKNPVTLIWDEKAKYLWLLQIFQKSKKADDMQKIFES